MIPFWFWFVTTTAALGAIAISAYVVVALKLAELDREFAKPADEGARR